MYTCYYVLSDKNKIYSSQLEECGCVEGDIIELVTKIRSDENFCRDQKAISYHYFVNSLIISNFNSNVNVLYIKNESGDKILGACSINIANLGKFIIVYSICVPDNGIKGIGTLLLDNLKCIGRFIDATCISLSAHQSVCEFYIKNGFIVEGDGYDEDNSTSMIYNFEQMLSTIPKGGTIKLTSQKKAKRRTRQAKRRTRQAKRGKTNKGK